MALQLISVSHLNIDCHSISGWVIFTETFKVVRSVNIHNNIETGLFTSNS